MTASEIIAELPTLTQADRREILRRIVALDVQREGIEFADDLLLAACQRVDEREREDASLFSHETAIQAFQAMNTEEGKNAGQGRS